MKDNERNKQMSKEVTFWEGVTKTTDRQPLSTEEKLKFCRDFIEMLRKSPELSKIFFNTQVYNEIVNDVTTRGAHSEGVSIVAENLARRKAILDGKSFEEAEISALLAKSLGYMHDLGHTPFGHDGEGALNNEMERFEATSEYKNNRKKLYGEKYTEQAGDIEAETMCYEHNETSSTIGSRMLIDFAKENGYVISKEALQYIKTGILAHSTSRVKTEPKGIEQKAVRLADKVAYIPQDLLDLLKQNVIRIEDLTKEEKGLLGLNAEVLTQKEQEEYDSLTTDEEKKQYFEDRKQYKLSLEHKLSIASKLPEDKRNQLFQILDRQVAEMQVEIASKCFTKINGEYQLDGQKSIVDFFDDAVNKGKIPPNHEITIEEMHGIALFTKMRDTQKHRRKIGIKINENGEKENDYDPIPEEKQAEEIEVASENYRQFLLEFYGMDPTMATLWVTKAKYQDAFIKGELVRTTEKDGSLQKEKLADINNRNDNAWKMKSTFQYFYSNIEQIPEDFREKYSSDEYTEQQLVSAFIASFTNKGLDELYTQLLDKELVISREQAITMLKEARPDLSIDKLVEESMKIKTQYRDKDTYELKEKDEKVSANDVLEQLVEENCGIKIVHGKNKNPERTIPALKYANIVRNKVEATTDKSIDQIKPQALDSLIDVSKTEVSSQDIQEMVQSIRERQDEKEIKIHISEVEQSERG